MGNLMSKGINNKGIKDNELTIVSRYNNINYDCLKLKVETKTITNACNKWMCNIAVNIECALSLFVLFVSPEHLMLCIEFPLYGHFKQKPLLVIPPNILIMK